MGALGEMFRRTTEHRVRTIPLTSPVESTIARSVLHHRATPLRRPSRRDSRIASSLAGGRPPLNNRAHLGSIRPSLFILRSSDALLTPAIPRSPRRAPIARRTVGLADAERFSSSRRQSIQFAYQSSSRERRYLATARKIGRRGAVRATGERCLGRSTPLKNAAGDRKSVV